MKKLSKKTLIITIYALFVIISVAGVWVMAGSSMGEEISKWKNSWQKKGTIEELIQQSEKTPLENLTSYNSAEFLAFAELSPCYICLSRHSRPISLVIFNEKYPIDYINQIDSDHIYVVYKLIDEYDKPMYIYLVFHNIVGEVDEIKKDDFEAWYLTEYYFTSGNHKYNDFASLKVSDSAKNVKAIDSVINEYSICNTLLQVIPVDKESKDNNVQNKVKAVTKSYHLLEDGLLIIEYISSSECETSEQAKACLQISNITFYKNYENLEEAMPDSYLFKNGKVELPS